jgi:hypothetical protein
MKLATIPATATFAVLCLLHAIASGQQAPSNGANPAPVSGEPVAMWPGATYDPTIPTVRAVLGHEPGERIVSPEEALRYLEALQAAAPARMRVVEYGRTWQDRPLVYAVIASEQNLARLDQIKQGMATLADPRRTDATAADALIRDLPAVVWLGYGIHGDEISSTDAALYTAYHLLAARDDELVSTSLESAIVVIDPSQNPDGRNRFVEYNRGAVGSEPSSSPVAAERDQPWPGGRGNHYLLDLNRDLIALTQPETRARVRALQEWYPLVVVDAHEMGAESTYFFPPNAEPSNPHITPAQQSALELFGRNNASWFDRFGFEYFTREVFDFFYPGYADTWATFQGGVGMTYEQASARGLVVRRPDRSLLTYRDGVRRHFTASISTIETAVRNRERLLRDFWSYRSSAIEEGRRGPVREHILPWRGDTSNVAALAAILVDHGIEVRRSTRALTACRQELPAGSVLVSTAQPAGRFARTLLETGADMQEAFVREQERRRRKNLPHEMYDITAWSLPLLFGVEQVACGDEIAAGSLEAVTSANARLTSTVAGADAGAVAYLVPWGGGAAGRFLVRALARGLTVLGADQKLVIGGREYPRGTLIVKARASEREQLAEALDELAAETGAEVVASETTWVDQGLSLGSDRVIVLRQPKVALAWDTPTYSNAAGAVRWVLEQRLGLPVTVVRTSSLAAADLGEFDVVILPDGEGYAGALRDAGADNLEHFVDRGGVLIAIAGAVSYLADPAVSLLSTRMESRVPPATSKDGGDETAASAKEKGEEETPSATGAATTTTDTSTPKKSSGRVPGKSLETETEYLAAIQARDAPPDPMPGALVRAVPDPDHWLTVGVQPLVNVMMQGSAIYTPLRLDQGTNALHFAGASDLVASGYLWKESREQLAWKPFTLIEQRGRGFVIGFTADPTFRGVLAGLDVLLLNAVVRAPAHAERD